MKAFVPCFYVLAVVSFSSAIVKQGEVPVIEKNDTAICLEENNITSSDLYTHTEIILNRHTESGNEERSRKNGCAIACVLKKKGLMEGNNFIEENVHTEVNVEFADPIIRLKAHEIAHNCMNEVKNITEECEKGLSLYTCTMNAMLGTNQ